MTVEVQASLKGRLTKEVEFFSMTATSQIIFNVTLLFLLWLEIKTEKKTLSFLSMAFNCIPEM